MQPSENGNAGCLQNTWVGSEVRPLWLSANLYDNDVKPDEIDEDPPEGELDPDSRPSVSLSMRIDMQGNGADAAKIGHAFSNLAKSLDAAQRDADVSLFVG